MFGTADHPWRPRWAVIKDARRRQRRRQRRTLAAVLAAFAAAAIGWPIASSADPGQTTAPPRVAAARVQAARLDGRVTDATTLHGNVWVLTCERRCAAASPTGGEVGQLTELDGRDLRLLKREPVPDPGVLTGRGGAIWLAHFATGNVSRVDPKTGRTTATLHLQLPRPITPGDRAFLPSGISFAAGHVWVATARGWLAEIDPHRFHVMRTVWSSSQATSATTAAGLTWVADELYGVGTFTANATHVTRHPIEWAGQRVSIDAVARGAGLIWTLGAKTNGVALTAGSVVTTINPTTGRITDQWSTPNGATMIVANRGAYVGGLNGSRILHLTAGHRPQTIPAPNFSALTTATSHALWTTTKAGKLLRIAITG